MENVVHHAAGVADLEAAGLHSANSCRTNDGHILGRGKLDQLASKVFWDTLGYDGNSLDLGIAHTFDRAVIG